MRCALHRSNYLCNEIVAIVDAVVEVWSVDKHTYIHRQTDGDSSDAGD